MVTIQIITPLKCRVCKEYYTIKDNGHFSSMKCNCSIIIYYYEYGIFREINKSDYIENFIKDKSKKGEL